MRPVRVWADRDGLLRYRRMVAADLGGWRRQHALSVWNAAMAVLMALAIEKAAYDVGRYDGPRWENRLR